MRLLESPSLTIFASGNSNTTFLLSDLNELCNQLKMLQLEKAGKKSNIINE